MSGVFYRSVMHGLGFLIWYRDVKNNKTRFFSVLYSDKTWDFDQSECAQDPIYTINSDKTWALTNQSARSIYLYCKKVRSLNREIISSYLVLNASFSQTKGATLIPFLKTRKQHINHFLTVARNVVVTNSLSKRLHRISTEFPSSWNNVS